MTLSGKTMKRKIKVGPHVYTVHMADLGALSDNYGTTIESQLQINVDVNMKKSKQDSVLAHEILHALIVEGGARELVKDNEELLVTILENTFYQFLNENTDFYAK